MTWTTGGAATRGARVRRILLWALLVACIGFFIFERWPRPPPALPVPAIARRLTSIAADWLELDASVITRRGPPVLRVVRFDGPVEFVPYHYTRAGFAEPQPVGTWADELRAPVVVNAGQFDDKLMHLGWLKAEDIWLSEHLKPQWKALLVSGPHVGAPFSGIVDLEQNNPRVVDGYRHAVQSMMLVDDSARVRVRDTDLVANRTVIAQDADGRMLILISQGAVTLADLARFIPTTSLKIVRAMNLDGGIEAQLAIRTPEHNETFYGQYGTGTSVLESAGGEVRLPLPAVIAARPAWGVA